MPSRLHEYQRAALQILVNEFADLRRCDDVVAALKYQRPSRHLAQVRAIVGHKRDAGESLRDLWVRPTKTVRQLKS